MNTTRRDFLLAISMGLTTCSSCSSSRRVSKVSGYVSAHGHRLDFIDGFISFAYEPMEWRRYSFDITLSHDPFTRDQYSKIVSGKWVDLNYQSVPKGFPFIRSTDNRVLSPSVCIVLGGWKMASKPTINTETRCSLCLRYFDQGSESFGIEKDQIKSMTSSIGPRVVVKVETSGNYTLPDGSPVEWDISFEGRTYDDPWPMKEIRVPDWC